MKRWIAGACAAILVLGLASFVWPSSAQEVSCGLGLPPGAPGYAEAQAREEADVRKLGYLRVCADTLLRYEMAFEPEAKAMVGLAFDPVDIGQSRFAQLRSGGAVAEAVNATKSRLYRRFHTAEGHALTLFEHDMSADGSRAWRDAKYEQERINGLPARLLVMQTGSGKALSQLSWMEGRRSYELWIDANVATRAELRAMLFALAASLPASKPACPGEAAIDPVTLGPDGLPVIPPQPTVLAEQTQACKR